MRIQIYFSSRSTDHRAFARITLAPKNKYVRVSATTKIFYRFKTRSASSFLLRSVTQNRLTGDDKMRRTRRQLLRQNKTNSSIRRVVKCKCMRVPPSNVLGKAFPAYKHIRTRTLLTCARGHA